MPRSPQPPHVSAARHSAQGTIKIGELNSYKAQPAFLDPYKKGWEMAIEEINAGGVLGKKLEVVSRDDGANPGDAVRVAEELDDPRRRQHPLRHVPLQCRPRGHRIRRQEEGVLPRRRAADRQDHLAERQPLYLPPAALDLHAGGDADAATRSRPRRSAGPWSIPNFEYGQSAAAAFKEMLKKAQPDVEFVTEQAPPLGKIDAGAVVQAIDDAKPDAIFSALFGGDLTKFVREGTTRGTFKDRVVVDLLGGEPEYLDPLKDEAPVGWIVTGYPWNEINTPEHKAFLAAYQKRYNDYPRLGSIVGYVTMKSLAAGIAKAGSTDTEKLIDAFRGLKVETARSGRSSSAPAIIRRRSAPSSARSRSRTATAPWRISNMSTAPRCCRPTPR